MHKALATLTHSGNVPFCASKRQDVIDVIDVVEDIDVDCVSVVEVAVVRQSSLASRTYKVFLVDPVDLLSSSLYRLHRTVPLVYMNALQPPSVYSRHLSAHASKQVRHMASPMSSSASTICVRAIMAALQSEPKLASHVAWNSASTSANIGWKS